MREERQRLTRYLLLLILLVVDFGQPVSTQEIINQIYSDVGCVDHPCDPYCPILLFSPLPFIPAAPCGVGTGIGLFMIVLMAILAVLLEQLYANECGLRFQVYHPNNTPHCYQLVTILWQKCKKALLLLFTLFAVGVTALLIILSGDVEQNPGPQETKLKVDDLGNLKRFLQPVTPYWVLIADQLGMTSQVANIQGTVANKGPSDFMRDLLLRWLSREHPCPTLEFFCQALRYDSEIIGGENVARKLEEEFQSHRGGEEEGDLKVLPSPPSFQRRQQDQLGPQRCRNEGQSPSESLTASEATQSSCISSESSFDQSTIDLPYVWECGCGKCTPDSYAKWGCPKGTLPFLKCDELSQEQVQVLKTTLTRESKNIRKQFQELLIATHSATKDMPVQEFLVHFMSLQVSPNKTSGLPFEDRFAEIESAPNVTKIFLILRDYISFFDYDIIEVIICSVSQKGDQLHSDLLRYKETFESYCKRRVFECPPQIGSKGNIKQAKFVLKLDGITDSYMYTLEKLQSFRNQVAEICQVSALALHLQKVEDGCIKVTFLIPSFLKDEIFPLSKDQKQALTDLGVVEFYVEVLEKAPSPSKVHVTPSSLPPSTKDIPDSLPPISDNQVFPQPSTKDLPDSSPIASKDIPDDHVRETKRQIWDGVSSIVDEDYMSPQVETDALHVYDTVFPVCMKKQHPFPVENLPAIKDASISDDNEEPSTSGSMIMTPIEASQTQRQTPPSEFIFAKPPSEKYFCQVTGELLLNPHLTACCGNHISQQAVSRLQQDKQSCPCPFCRKDLATLLDKSFQRKVLALKVRCQHFEEGCTWIGDLNNLRRHLSTNNINGECQYVEVTCPHSCGEYVQRHCLEQHKSQCLKRPYTCQYCSYEATYEEVINTHLPICETKTISCPQKCGEEEIEHKNLQEHLRNCPKQVVACEYHDAGCLVKLENQMMCAHMQDNVQDHLFKVAQWNKVLIEQNKALIKENKELKENNEKLTSIQEFHSPSNVPIPQGPAEFIMTGFEEHKRLADKWFSPSFYTSMGGYRMCLRVRACGRGTSLGMYVGVSVRLMRGEYDDSLHWPFRGKITLQLINQRRDGGHIEKTVLFEDSLSDEYSGRVVGLERAERGRGLDLIAHTDLPYNCAEDTEYLRNDSIIIRVTKVVVHTK